MSEEDGAIFEFYKKKARKDLFVHFQSDLPVSSKIHFIRNERQRIASRCSRPSALGKHSADFDRVLKINGYPSHIIRETQRSACGRGRRQVGDFSYFRIPFVSETVDKRITRIFRREGLEVRLAHRSTTLRSALAKRKPFPRCTLSGCTIASPPLCFRKKVVIGFGASCARNFTLAAPSGHFTSGSGSTCTRALLPSLSIEALVPEPHSGLKFWGRPTTRPISD